MAKLSLRHIYKVYPNGVKAVNDFNMEIDDNEFIVFVGPSGCGKSTTLRMIAGLEDISAGELYIGDELVNDVEPKDRDISMVFQNYALYPHMTVYDNMAFGLKLRHVPQAEIHQKVLWAADALKLTEFLDRKPRAMSGGQRQRVALGRAILRNPKVFLLDEPLSNLDAKLRTEMRAEIANLHNTLGTTFIYVTHDQVEAMTLGTRVVVMKLGYIQQVDTPQNLYNYPENKFVAGFIGTPQMNFFKATLKREKDLVKVHFASNSGELVVPFNDMLKVRPSYLNGDKNVWVGLRCEDLSLDKDVVEKSKNVLKMRISHFEELGNETLVYGNLDLSGNDLKNSESQIIVKAYSGAMGLRHGDVVDVAFNMAKSHFFDYESEQTIAPRIPVENVFDCSIKNHTLEFLGQKIALPSAIKVDDIKDAELFVPTDAIHLNGDIEVKVVNIEEVKDVKIAYLQLKDRIFFVVNNDLKVGDKLKIGMDLKKITIANEDEILVKPLKTYNMFVGSFTNLENNKKAINSMIKLHNNETKSVIDKITQEKNLELGELGLNDALLAQAKIEYKEAVEKVKSDLSYAIGTLDLGKEGKAKLRNESKAKLQKLKDDFLARKAELEKMKTSATGNEEVLNKSKEINKRYEDKIAKIKESSNEYVSTLNKGSAAFKEKAKVEIANSKSRLEAELKDLQEKKQSAQQQLLKSEDYTKADEKTREKMVKELVSKFDDQRDELITDSKVFFLSINGCYVKSAPHITKRIVQALGVAVFNSNYRFEIGVNSLSISDNGFEAQVEDVLDYGNDDCYAVCRCFGNYIVIKKGKAKLKAGDIIKLMFDLSDIRIFENKFDIRLY